MKIWVEMNGRKGEWGEEEEERVLQKMIDLHKPRKGRMKILKKIVLRGAEMRM